MNAPLLPSGLYDLLPPDAARESALVQEMLKHFAAYGYEQVAPPLLEFEDELLSARGKALSTSTFRVMDLISKRMMGLRADHTMQIARIATSRLANSPRPLRLAYAGQVTRVQADALSAERQLMQLGIEIIGIHAIYADAEVIDVATGALAKAGVKDISVDLNMPGFLEPLLRGMDEDTQRAAKVALAQKDRAALKELPQGALLADLCLACGPASEALDALGKLALPAAMKAPLEMANEAVAYLIKQRPDLSLTLDPVENRGFEYHVGLSFSLFAKSSAREIGRGGRYPINDGEEELATGITLYTAPLLRLLPAMEKQPRIFLPFGTAKETTRALQQQGFVTIHAVEETSTMESEARRLQCSHIWANGKAQEL